MKRVAFWWVAQVRSIRQPLRWLAWPVAIIAALFVVAASAQTGERRSSSFEPVEVVLDTIALGRGNGQRTRVTPDGIQPEAAGGMLITVPQEVNQFSDLLASWRADEPLSSTLHISMRVSSDGSNWSRWALIEESHDFLDERDAADLHWGSPMFAGLATWWQAKIEFGPAPDGSLPTLRELRVSTVDVGALTPTEPEAAAERATDVAKPPVVSRTGWGSPDGQGSRVAPAYYPVTHMVVHHTADANSLGGSEGWWGDRIRAIWSFHTFTRGWGDIGYNYLIAPDGTIFEGRAGGDNAVAFHDTGNYGSMGVSMVGTYASVPPTSIAQNSLVELLAWKAEQRGIDPLGRAYYYGCDISRYCGNPGSITPNIGGHRDVANNPVGYTSCPGDNLYGLLPTIRSRVQSRLSSTPDNGDMTIDDLESSFTRSAAQWYEAACGDGGHIFYTYSTNDPLESSNSGRWRNANIVAGNYRIFAHVPQNCGGLNATQSARYTVWQNGVQIGERVLSQDTTTEWIEITTSPLALSGVPVEVHLTDLTNEPLSAERKVIFDTVRWVKQDTQVDVALEAVNYDRTTLAGGELLKVTFRVRNTGNVTLETQAPDAGSLSDSTTGYTYDEGECFIGNGNDGYPSYPKESGRFRVVLGGDGLTMACAGDTGGYPWRWSIGGDLAPGEARDLVGYVRFRNHTTSPRQVTLRAGLVQEYVRYFSQNQANQIITINPENDAPQSLIYNDWQPQALVYELGAIPDDFLARTANPLSIPEGALLGSFGWSGTRLDLGAGGLFGQNDRFIVRQTRSFVAPVAGNYRFCLTSDDGAWLWIDEELVAEAHGLHPEREVIGERWLSAGEHQLGFKYFERTSQAVLSYDWQTPGSNDFSPIPVNIGAGATRYGNYFAPNAQMTIAADDHGGSGVASIRWRWNGSAWEEDAGSMLTFTPGGGNFTLEYAARDAAGNLEATRSLSWQVDASPPSSTISSATVEPTGVIRLNLSSNDVGSGVRQIEISVRDQADGQWSVWTVVPASSSPVFIGQPDHRYDFRSRAIDNVNNREAEHNGVDASATVPNDASFYYIHTPLVIKN
ncbi:N-acetylmuramoyl-L-alanine amidase [Herpetosiphon llansteffanensis]